MRRVLFELDDEAKYGGGLSKLHFLKEIEMPIGRSALYFTVRAGDLEVVKWLIDNSGIDVETWLVINALQYDHLEIFKFLLSRKMLSDEVLLYQAVSCQAMKILDWLLRKGCVSDRDLMVSAVIDGNEAVIKILKDFGYG